MSSLERNLAQQKNKTLRLSFAALLIALSLILSYLESLLPPLAPFPLRYGLSNIALMLALIWQGIPLSFGIVLVKAGFALATRGSLAGLLSLVGGLAALLAMGFSNKLSEEKISYFLLSALGASAHNIAQIAILILFFGYQTRLFFLGILPSLLLLGLLSSLITGFLAYLVENNLAKHLKTYRAVSNKTNPQSKD